MAEAPKGFGEQLFKRLQGQGLSRAHVYKALALQKLTDGVMELGAEGKLSEACLVEIAKIKSPARQKQLAEIAVQRELSNVWVKELARLIRNAEKTANDKEANRYWDFFFDMADALAREGTGKALLDRLKNFSVDQTEVIDAGDRQVVDFRKYSLVPGRGLDVGTSNICASVKSKEGKVLYNIQRNAFLDVRSDTFTKKMLMKLGVDHVVQGEKGYVVGDAAFELANIFEKNTRRPMKDGIISPTENEALLILSLIISQLLGPPGEPGEICSFSVPADPIDADRNVIYHRGTLEAILRKLGYAPKPIVEGHCVVLGELAGDDYTGVGISCGAGMFNVCIAYKSVPALTFSTSRGGDWIDNNVAHALGLSGSQVCAVKESGVDLGRPRDRVEEAICIYYRNLIAYTLEEIRKQFEHAHNMPSFNHSVPLVCAGGTSMVKGFIDVFREEFNRSHFPIDVKEIRLSKDPLRTVAFGGCVDAIEETKARGKTEKEGPVNVTRSEPSKVTTIVLGKAREAYGGGPAHAPVGIPRSEPAKVEKFEVPQNAPRPEPPPLAPAKPAAAAEPPPPAVTSVPRAPAAKVEPFQPPAPVAVTPPKGAPVVSKLPPLPERPVGDRFVPRPPPAAKVEPFQPPAPAGVTPPRGTPIVSKLPPLPEKKEGTGRWSPPTPNLPPSPPPFRPRSAVPAPPPPPPPPPPAAAPSRPADPPAPKPPAKRPQDTDFSEWKGMIEELGTNAPAGKPLDPVRGKPPAKDAKKDKPDDKDRGDIPLFS